MGLRYVEYAPSGSRTNNATHSWSMMSPPPSERNAGDCLTPGGSVRKESACKAGDACGAGDQRSIAGSGRTPGEGNSKPVQYSCLENPMDRGDLWATIHGVTRVGHDLENEQHQQYTQQKESHVFTKRHTQKYS